MAAGCTLLNGFDDVRPLVEGTYEAGAADVAAGDAHADADGGGGPAGAVVVGGRVRDDAGGLRSVLTVLDPANGHEIAAREPMVVAAIRYDGLRDLWFLFESTTPDFAPGPGDEVILHVRTLDRASGRWTELSRTTVPTLQSYECVGVVRDRLAFVAYASPDAGAPLELVTLDTSDPTSIAVLGRLPLDEAPLGLLATRSVTGVGGQINLLRLGLGACDGGLCPLSLLPVRVPNAGAPVFDAPVTVGASTANARASFATFARLDRDVIVFPRTSSDAAAPTSAVLLEPRTHQRRSAETPFIVTDALLRPAAAAECRRSIVLVGGNSDLDLHVVPLVDDGGGAAATSSTGHSGQAVYFEPTSSTAFAPFNQGEGFDFSAFRVGGTEAAPTLTRREPPEWEPPPDLRPVLLGVRARVPIECP